MLRQAVTDDKRQSSAVLIQKVFRGYYARLQYKISELPLAERKSYKTFLVGNDPVIQGLDLYASNNKPIALVGTSGLRSLLLALQLSRSEAIPKCVIIDNSQDVITFWRKFRAFAERHNGTKNSEEFMQSFDAFIIMNKTYINHLTKDYYAKYNTPTVKYHHQDPHLFLRKLLDTYGLTRVLRVISSATVICQSWVDKATLLNVTRALRKQGIEKIYVYPSNIGYCMIYQSLVDSYCIFQNIEAIRPTLAIHTADAKIPNKVFFCIDNSAKNAFNKVTSLQGGFIFPNKIKNVVKFDASLADGSKSNNDTSKEKPRC